MAKTKCIVRSPHTLVKDKGIEDSSSAVILGSRIAALENFICKLQNEGKIWEKERNEAQKELMSKEEEISVLREKLAVVEQRGIEASEEEINLKANERTKMRKEEEVSVLRVKLAVVEQRGVEASEEEINLEVNERTKMLKNELERKIQECQKMTDELVEIEERIFQQQKEVEKLRPGRASVDMEGGSFMKRLLEICSEDDSEMVKSMDLSKSIDMETNVIHKTEINGATAAISGYPYMNYFGEGLLCTRKNTKMRMKIRTISLMIKCRRRLSRRKR